MDIIHPSFQGNSLLFPQLLRRIPQRSRSRSLKVRQHRPLDRVSGLFSGREQ